METKAIRCRMISCFAQILNEQVLEYKIPEFVKGEKIKARKFSYDSQMYLLMLGQFLHVFSLNELADISNIYAKKLSRIRGIDPASHSTFSNANRTRNPEVMEKFFWMMYGTINTGVFKSDLISKKIRAISAETIRYYGTSFSYWIAM